MGLVVADICEVPESCVGVPESQRSTGMEYLSRAAEDLLCSAGVPDVFSKNFDGVGVIR